MQEFPSTYDEKKKNGRRKEKRKKLDKNDKIQKSIDIIFKVLSEYGCVKKTGLLLNYSV